MPNQGIPKSHFISRVELFLRALAVVNWNLGQCLAYKRYLPWKVFLFFLFLN